MPKSVTVRIAADGGVSVRETFRAIGREGKSALDGITANTGPASAGLNRVDDSAGRALTSLDALAAKAARTAANLRAAGASTGTMVERIDRVTGVSRGVARSADDIEAYGRALDDTRAKFNPLYATIRQYKASLEEIRAANRAGAISADEMTAAIQRQRQAALADIAVIKGRTTGLNMMSRSTGNAAFRMQNLTYQLNDIGVSLAGGMNPFLVLAQQGTQVAQIYGFGNGGVSGIFRDLGSMVKGVVTRFPLLTVAAVAAGAAIGGMRHEINASQKTMVSFGDVGAAIFQVLGSRIYDQLKPAIDSIGSWFSSVWDLVIEGVRRTGNFIINGWTIAIDGVRTAVSVVPDIFLAAFNMAVSHVLTKMHDMVWYVGNAISQIAAAFNSTFGTTLNTDVLSGTIKTLSDASGTYMDAAGAAQDRIAGAWDGFTDRAAKTMGNDPMGQFYEDVKNQAIQNANDRAKKKKKGGGGSAKVDPDIALAKRIFDETRTAAEKYAKTIEDLDRLLGKGLINQDTYNRAVKDAKEEFTVFGQAAKQAADLVRNAFDGLFDDPAKALKDLAKQMAQLALYTQLAKSFPGVFGADGAIPLMSNAVGGVYSGPGISAYSGRVVDQPTLFPFARGVGLMGEAGPEAILPLTRVGGKLGVQANSSAPPSQTVNIYNQSGSKVTETRRRGPDGGEVIDVHIKKQMASGAYDQPMQRFGNRPQVVKR